MSLTFEVSLMSGKTVSLKTHGDESVESLRVRAQRVLGVGKGRLLNSAGSILNEGVPLKKAELQYEEPLTFQVGHVDVCGGRFAFAAILGDGSVETWGTSQQGGGQQCFAGSAEECATHSSNLACVCWDPGGWLRRELGLS